MPLIASGIGVAAFFCFMFSWVELLLSRTLTSVNAKPIAATMTRTVSASGMDWGVLAAAGVLTHRARRARHLLRPQLHRQGLRPGEGVSQSRSGFAMVCLAVAAVFAAILAALLVCAIPARRRGHRAGRASSSRAAGWPGPCPSRVFFLAIAALLALMTLLAIRYPETPRVGILRIETTRGDRLFITLLGSAFINLAWLFFFGAAALGRARRLPRLRRGGLPLGLDGKRRSGRARRPREGTRLRQAQIQGRIS